MTMLRIRYRRAVRILTIHVRHWRFPGSGENRTLSGALDSCVLHRPRPAGLPRACAICSPTAARSCSSASKAAHWNDPDATNVVSLDRMGASWHRVIARSESLLAQEATARRSARPNLRFLVEDLCSGARGQRRVSSRIDSLLDESDRAIAEQEVAAAGVLAPIRVGVCGPVIRCVHPHG